MTIALARSVDETRSRDARLRQRLWSAVRSRTPVIPLEIYRVVGGLALLLRTGAELADSSGHPARLVALGFAGLGAVLVMAGAGTKWSAAVVSAAFAALAKTKGQTGGFADFMTATTAFWLLCLPVGNALTIGRRRAAGAREVARAGLARHAFVAWLVLVCAFGGLWNVAWGGVIPEPALRVLMGLLFASLIWPVNTPARFGGAALFAFLVAGLLLRLGPNAGTLAFAAGSLVVWAPEIAARIEHGAVPADASEGRIDGGSVVACFVLALLVLSLLPVTVTPARMSAAILRDAGIGLVGAPTPGSDARTPAPGTRRAPEASAR